MSEPSVGDRGDQKSRPGRVAVVGGTGTLGGFVVSRLADAGIDVRIAARDAAAGRHLEREHVEVVPGDVRDVRALEKALDGCDATVSAFTAFGRPEGGDLQTADLQGNINLIGAAEKAGVGHFVLVSVYGAAPHSPLEIRRVKHEVERRLKSSSLQWTIIRPTPSMEIYTKLLAEPLLREHKTRVFGRGDNPINFVSQRDVAAFIELALIDAGLRGQTIDVGGPDNLTVNQLIRRFEALTGATGSEQHVPVTVLRAMSVIAKPFNPMMARMAKAAVAMDTTDMTFDDIDTLRRYPTVKPTSLDDVVRRDYTKAA